MSDVRRIPEQVIPARVEVTVTFTNEEYAKVSNDAAWREGGSVSTYIKRLALGHVYRGC